MGACDSKHMWHYICIDCRIGAKSMKAKRLCQTCGKEMTYVSVTFRIPKKTDNKAWKEVTKEIKSGNTYNHWWWIR